MPSPYADLPPRAFWRTAVAGREAAQMAGLFEPKFALTKAHRILTAGSCFAQHVGRALRGAGFDVIEEEPAPAGMPALLAQRFGYGLYSARYGNLYTTRHLRQLLEEAAGLVNPADPVWERSGRFFDAQRPGVEPEGLDTPDLVALHRRHHLAAIGRALDAADVVVFTLGLTEGWIDADTGTAFPTAPETIAGHYDPARHHFVNDDYPRVLSDFLAARDLIRARRPDMRFVLTVSPVPLTATMSGQHVEVATTGSKAVLRAVAGHLAAAHDDIDYFPSYEIITSQTARGRFYAANRRSVTEEGVQTAMACFLAAHGVAPLAQVQAPMPDPGSEEDDVICEEALLDALRR